jgi:hypothetical protein
MSPLFDHLMLRRSAIALCLSLSVTAASSCGLLRANPSAEEDDDVVILDIENHHQLDVVIYNVRQGYRERLGEVVASSKGSFRVHINRYPAGEIQLYASPIGGPRGVTSEVVHPFAGQTVEWTLETDLARSFLMIRD